MNFLKEEAMQGKCEVLVRPLINDDLDPVVQLHLECFKHYFMSGLGTRIVKLFYSQFLSSPHHFCLVAIKSGTVIGFIAGTKDSALLFSNFYRENFFKVLYSVLFGFILNRAVRHGLFSRRFQISNAIRSFLSSSSSSSSSRSTVKARILSIAIAENIKGEGVGSLLINSFMKYYFDSGVEEIGLSVLKENETAVRFYEAKGFEKEFETPTFICFFLKKKLIAENNETVSIKNRYLRRENNSGIDSYSWLNVYTYKSEHEKERKLIHWLNSNKLTPLNNKTFLEVGCGAGMNLAQMIKLGFQPVNLIGNELIDSRAESARKNLPKDLEIIVGDASLVDFGCEMFDIVYQSTVFTSILDSDFQQKLATKLWSHIKPGGYFLWYDFIYNNPRNFDVRGVPIKKIRKLFPHGELRYQRVTLAPPIGRFVCRIHPSLYGFFNMFPFLRTHVLCSIRKTL